MESTVTQSTDSMTTISANTSSTSEIPPYHPFLMGLYIVVLISGTICLSLTKLNISSSPTSIAVLNLVFAHIIFLLTVPFRIYYYSIHEWNLGLELCRVISSMIHVHMYMSFLFYAIILITRLLPSDHKTHRLPSCGSLDSKRFAVLVSAVVWIVVLVAVPCVVSTSYGTKDNNNKNTNETERQCFRFATHIDFKAKVFNYIVSAIIIVVTMVLTALQAKVLLVIKPRNTLNQEFRSELMSMCFALIMVASFIPYHIFRLHYIENLDLQDINEVFLSLTTLNCLDMLTFLGRRPRVFDCC